MAGPVLPPSERARQVRKACSEADSSFTPGASSPKMSLNSENESSPSPLTSPALKIAAASSRIAAFSSRHAASSVCTVRSASASAPGFCTPCAAASIRRSASGRRCSRREKHTRTARCAAAGETVTVPSACSRQAASRALLLKAACWSEA